ncbi:MAG: hypothetical protein IPJ75_14470 [Ignavibacteriales bacterium]|nr:hypothetical protein [Ignavibacteriales bacterium]
MDDPTANTQVDIYFHFFPNPVNDILNVECLIPEGAQTVLRYLMSQVKDLLPNQMKRDEKLNTRINVRAMGLASGIYFRVSSSGTRNYSKTAKSSGVGVILESGLRSRFYSFEEIT